VPADSAAPHLEGFEMPLSRFFLNFRSRVLALFRRARPAGVVLAVEPPIAFGDVVVGTNLHPGDKHRVHEALELAARRQAA
jgi:hypothetical protein